TSWRVSSVIMIRLARPSRELLAHDPSAVVRSCLHGDLLAGQHGFQGVFGIGMSITLMESATVPERAVPADPYRSRGHFLPEDICCTPVSVEKDRYRQAFLFCESADVFGCFACIGIESKNKSLAFVVLR